MTGRDDGRTRRAGTPRAAAPQEAAASVLADVAAACVAVALLWAPQERLVWQPPARGRLPTRDREAPAGARRIDARAADGQALLAWLVEPDVGVEARGTLVAFHGNAELAAWGVPWARAVAARTGWRVVLAEYRGYAGLGGTPGYLTSAGDARSVFAALPRAWRAGAALGAPFALFGHSLGSAVAAELAAELAAHGEPLGALVLQAPFSSVRDMARVGAWPGGDAWWTRVARVHFDTAARVAALDVPVWVAHGLMDAIVPARMGRLVHATARRPGDLLLVPGAGHNRLPDRGGARYWAWLAGALRAAAGAGTNGAQEAGTHHR